MRRLLGLALLVFAVPAPAHAAGCPKSLQSAIDDARAGDVIHVCAGTYAGDLRIGKPLTLRGAGADLVTVKDGITATKDVTISGVTVDGGGILIDGAKATVARTRVTNVVSSEAADAYSKPRGWRSDFPGIGIEQRGKSGALTLDHVRVERYNRIGVSIEGKGIVRGSQIVGRVVCQNFPKDGDCSAPAVVSDGPLFGQDGIRVKGGSLDVTDTTISQNLVEGSGASSNLPLGAGVRLLGAGQSSIARSNIVDNAYGVMNLTADGSGANTTTPVKAEDNWWGLFSLSPVNAGPAVSPAVPPQQPENPVNGNPTIDPAGGPSSDAVDFFPYRNGSQSDPNSGEWPVSDAPGGPDEPDTPGCTPTREYDSSIPTFSDVVGNEDGGNVPAGAQRHVTADLYAYQEAVVAATKSNPRIRVIEKDLGPTTLDDQHLKIVVVGTPEHIAHLEDDAAFWSGVVSGRVPEAQGIKGAESRPAFAWVTATPHGNEPAAGEATMRLLYELAARKDCANAARLGKLDLFIDPARNPDGRDQPPIGQRLTPWGFDPNRDFGTRTQVENSQFMPLITRYPGLFFIDAHQQTTGYFFPPNEDPVHHEISHFALDLIQKKIGPALQQRFNDQTSAYQNYNTYDLFTPEYGDTVPSLIMGAAGMTYEKGEAEDYGKQVYDHYLAMDTTVNTVANDKPALTRRWVEQWQEAVDQGARCELQDNVLVSPLHDKISQQPRGSVCGYFYKPGLHTGDVAKLVGDLQSTGVNVYRLDRPVTVGGVHEFGPGATKSETLPEGTLWIPMDQPMKHWIQAVLGENPFIPFAYYYDVVTWSYSLMRGLGGDGVLTRQMPSGTRMHKIGAPQLGSAPAAAAPVYAFATDSMAGLGLVVDLLDKGAKVSRAGAAFDAGGTHFPTGAALVDGSTIKLDDLARAAAARQTPVIGLPGNPAGTKFPIAKPKIGIYTGAPVEPPNPDPVGHGAKGYCTSAVALSGTYCEALFTLKEKDKLPASSLVALTDEDIATLPASGITAVLDPNGTMPDSAALQAFVNQGGTFVATGSSGTTAARSSGMTNVNTTSISGLLTPGSTFQATFDTRNPVAWGFDEGGWIYRSENGDPVYDPSTLGDAVAAVSYAKPGKSFGYQVNAVGPDKLDGRPAVIDQPFGAGHVVLLGFNPFFRAWHEGSERMALNALLYPTIPAASPLPAVSLPKVGLRPAVEVTSDRDIIVAVHDHDAGALRRAVRLAALPRAVSEHVTYEGRARLVIKGVRGDDFERRADWVGRLMGRLKAAKVRPVIAQV